MSATLLVMIPFVLLATVSALCFVGCALDASGIPGPPRFKYSDDTVLADTDRLLAYWRLNDGPGTAAVNAAMPGTADGLYLSQMFLADPASNSAAAPGTLNLGQPGLLQGDLQSPFTAGSTPQVSIFVDGGWVSVGWHSSLAPSEADGFTIEAWVAVGWGDKDPKADRTVVVALESNGVGLNGFGIKAAMDDTWQAFVGTGTGITFTPGSPRKPDNSDHHLVATYSAGTLKLYVNGMPTTSVLATYAPTTGVSSSPDAPSRLYIGAGGPQLVNPTQPFKGNLQCVALYRGAFSDADVLKHFNDGNTGPTS